MNGEPNKSPNKGLVKRSIATECMKHAYMHIVVPKESDPGALKESKESGARYGQG